MKVVRRTVNSNKNLSYEYEEFDSIREAVKKHGREWVLDIINFNCRLRALKSRFGTFSPDNNSVPQLFGESE